MFDLFLPSRTSCPPSGSSGRASGDEAGRARVVCDYIAGMTDRFAIEEHRKLFNLDVWG